MVCNSGVKPLTTIAWAENTAEAKQKNLLNKNKFKALAILIFGVICLIGSTCPRRTRPTRCLTTVHSGRDILNTCRVGYPIGYRRNLLLQISDVVTVALTSAGLSRMKDLVNFWGLIRVKMSILRGKLPNRSISHMP